MWSRLRVSAVLFAIVLLLAACGPPAPATEMPDLGPSPATDAPDDPVEEEEDEPTSELPELPGEDPTDEPTATPALIRVGEVEPDQDMVRQGRAEIEPVQLSARGDLHDGDSLEIDEGGVANVDLDNGWQFLLFNQTRLGVELGDGETIQDVMVMQSGTLLGRRAIEECEDVCTVSFPLPEGRTINIYGTTFFIVLDEDTQEVIAGNFDGGVEVIGDGVSMFVPPATFIMGWQPNQAPDQAIQGTIEFSPQDFEGWGYGLDAPADFGDVVCNDDSAYLTDVTVPDGTQLEPGERFVKTWRLENDGACQWGDGYAIEFIDGDQLAQQESVVLDVLVEPGETTDISVEMIAPERPGDYRGWWQLSNDEGQLFGQTPYVDIEVVDVVAPAPPTLISPKSDTTLTGEGDCPPVQMSWSQPDDLSGIGEYRLMIQTVVEGSWSVVEDVRQSAASFTYNSRFCDMDPRRFAWRVAAFDGAGNASQFSEWDYFYLGMTDTTPPPAPQLISPADGASFSGSSCPSMEFVWSEPSDPSGIDEYAIEISRWLGDAWGIVVATPVSGTRYPYSPSYCSAVTTYYRWRVRAYDNEGNRGAWSPYRGFTNNSVIQ